MAHPSHDAATQTHSSFHTTKEAGCQTWKENPVVSFQKEGLKTEDQLKHVSHLDFRVQELMEEVKCSPSGPDITLSDPGKRTLNGNHAETINENDDILYVLKVKRYWQFPSSAIPNIFKKRCRKIVKGRIRPGPEVLDLSRWRTNAKKSSKKSAPTVLNNEF
jgi:hypothetical protein